MKKRILNVIKWILIRFFDINIDSKNNVNLSNRFKKVPKSVKNEIIIRHITRQPNY